MDLRMDLQRDRKRTPKGTQSKNLKDGFQGFVFRKVVQYRFASRRIASHRVASRRIASHRVALTFDKDYKAFKKQKQGRPEYLLQRTPPVIITRAFSPRARAALCGALCAAHKAFLR